MTQDRIAPALTDHLRRAGPLSDPVRLVSTLIIINTALVLVLVAITVARSVNVSKLDGAEFGLLVVLVILSVVLQPLAMWLLLRPAQRQSVLYLRAFRSDVEAVSVRRLIRAALGSRQRLSGIRPPRERVSMVSRLLLTAATGFRYLGSEYFDLEASDHNWMPRLLASMARARFVFIDVRDVTIHVADEIQVCYVAMGPDRCIFLTDNSLPEGEWAQKITTLLGDAASSATTLHLLTYEGDSADLHESFVRRTADLVNRVQPAPANIARASTLVQSRVPVANWPTPITEKGWAQVAAGVVLVNSASFAPLGWALVPAIAIGLVTSFFYIRAIVRSWRDARFQARLRPIVGGPNPLWRPRIVAVLSAFGFLFSIGVPLMISPALQRSKMIGMETSALMSLMMINTAQVNYSTGCGNGGYADTFAALTADDALPPNFAGANTVVTRSGYRFTLGPAAGAQRGPVDCHGQPTVTDYDATATPETFGQTGTRSFATNGNFEIWQDKSATPPKQPFGPPAEPIR